MKRSEEIQEDQQKKGEKEERYPDVCYGICYGREEEEKSAVFVVGQSVWQ